MTLSTRLSLFFLTSLAVVLAGFSLALYGLARNHLQRQSEQQLAAAMNTLVAAVEIAPEGLVWDRAERRLDLSDATSGGRIAWIIRDNHGQVVDQSADNLAGDFPALDTAKANETAVQENRWRGELWRFRQQRIETPGPPLASAAPPDEEPKHQALSVAAGICLEPMHATLRTLAATLAALSACVWLVALLAGRALSSRAIAPLTAMASAAREMSAADFEQRLSAPGSADELQDLAVAFNGLLDRLQDSYERQRRFTGDASHQLRTPLAGMLGQIEVALRRERPASEYQAVLTTVHEQAQRLRKIVESLLFLARADSEAQLPARERVDLAQWLPAHLREWSQHGRSADILVENGDAGPLPVLAHPPLLGELVNILLDNACKFSPPGTPIVLRLSRDAESIRLRIEDRGLGIDTPELPQLFRPFFRTAAAQQQGISGVGLGLAIARRLAKSHGGTLVVESEAGRGTCFTLSLLAATGDSKATSAPQNKPELMLASPGA